MNHGHVSVLLTTTSQRLVYCRLCDNFPVTVKEKTPEAACEFLKEHLRSYHMVKDPEVTVDPNPHPLFIPVSEQSSPNSREDLAHT